ncbi:MAG: DUF2239 family protein [Paludibacterium sp.]|uniref:DUF2239 family protein n=1 Tax=Paludibacterium sp. TaxID=1917523 RepID=UPI0025FD6C22|nr:DUF2239 family protein [Paludibacterium sp.]MBV8048120.1 DUF2239 family protein [Paludibacterium sp.]
MSNQASQSATAFQDQRLLSAGPLCDVALAVKAALARGASASVLVFADETGRVVDLDLRGDDAEVVARLSVSAQAPAAAEDDAAPRGRGRPKLGVVAREVTLLPRQWEWLATQPGGASAVLRRLVDEARRNENPRQKRRAAQEAAYRVMLALAGDLPGYEEATRALFADDRARFEQSMAAWPQDVCAYALRLAFPHEVST